MSLLLQERRHELLLKTLFGIAAFLICLLEIFPEQYYVFNIGIVLVLLAHYVLLSRFILKENIAYAALLALFLIMASLDVARISFFVFYLFLQSKNIYKRSFLKQYFGILLLCFVAVVIAYEVVGFNEAYDRLSWSPVKQGYIEEKALGFVNPNRCMLYLFCLSCLALLLSKKTWQYIAILAVNYVFYTNTQSRTFFYIMVFIIAILLLLKLFRWEMECSFIGKVVPLAFLGLLALSIILPQFFSNTFLNALFTGRLYHNKAFLETGITFFGNAELESATFDSSYLHMLLTKGIVFFALFTILLIGHCRKARINNKRAVLLCAIFMTGFMEVIFLECNIMYLIGAMLYWEDSKGVVT